MTPSSSSSLKYGYKGMMKDSVPFEEKGIIDRENTRNPLWELQTSSESDASVDERGSSRHHKERSHKDRKHRKHNKKSKRKHNSRSSDSGSENSHRRRKKRERKSSAKIVQITMDTLDPTNVSSNSENIVDPVVAKSGDDSSSSSEDEAGPQPLSKIGSGEDHISSISHGKQLMPGEGKAIAQYVAEGLRIPRRGEIGLNSDQISKYENEGFVMSGSRHSVMNAVRLRKENQIYSNEEKHALVVAKMNDNLQKEEKLRMEFRQMLDEQSNEKTKK